MKVLSLSLTIHIMAIEKILLNEKLLFEHSFFIVFNSKKCSFTYLFKLLMQKST